MQCALEEATVYVLNTSLFEVHTISQKPKHTTTGLTYTAAENQTVR